MRWWLLNCLNFLALLGEVYRLSQIPHSSIAQRKAAETSHRTGGLFRHGGSRLSYHLRSLELQTGRGISGPEIEANPCQGVLLASPPFANEVTLPTQYKRYID